jgi:hypothetical protein
MLRRPISVIILDRQHEQHADQRQEGDTLKGGQPVISGLPPEHHPGDKRCKPDQHGEGVVVEVSGLQPDDTRPVVSAPARRCRRAEAVDEPAVTLLPQEAAEPLRRADKDEVVELVDVPLVEQELVEA